MPAHPILSSFFFFNDTATTEIYTLSLHDALPISDRDLRALRVPQSALRRLHRPLVPDGVAQDVLSGRVHGRSAVVRNRQYRQGGAVHQRGARAGPRGAAA